MSRSADPPPVQVQQIDHVELFVPERRAAADWYRTVLGLEIVERCRHWAEDPGGPLMISPDGGSTMVALFRGAEQGNRTPIGLRRLAFRIGGADFVRFLDRAADLGLRAPDGEAFTRADAVDRGAVFDHGAAWSVYFTDPWGTCLEVTTYEIAEVGDRMAAG